jgi:hypothetical protein
MRTVHRFSAVLGLSVLLAACQAAPTTTPGPTAPGSQPPSATPSPTLGTESSTLLLRVTSEGGFIGPSANLATVPSVSVYADGRILTPGAIDAIYPGPLVPPVSGRSVGSAGAASILAAIHAAGLDVAGGSDGPGNPDMATTVITVVIDGQPVVSRFTALGGGPPGPHPGASNSPNTAAVLDLLNRLQDPAETWGGTATAATPYVPVAYRIFVAPGAPAADAPAAPVVWPLSTPLAAFGTPAVPDRGIAGLRSGIVSGQDAATLAPVLAGATAITPFASGGASFTLYVRPLLPDEAV